MSAIETSLPAMSPASQRIADTADTALACPRNAARALADAPVTVEATA